MSTILDSGDVRRNATNKQAFGQEFNSRPRLCFSMMRMPCGIGQQCYSDHVQQFQRITTSPEVMGGKPCIRGMRVTVGMIVEALAAGRSVENLLSDFPYLEEPDIREALAYAANLAQGREFPLAS
jgi:uncharacterized protein (DUF433 family)